MMLTGSQDMGLLEMLWFSMPISHRIQLKGTTAFTLAHRVGLGGIPQPGERRQGPGVPTEHRAAPKAGLWSQHLAESPGRAASHSTRPENEMQPPLS